MIDKRHPLPMPGDIVIASAFDYNDDPMTMVLRAGWRMGDPNYNYLICVPGQPTVSYINICEAAEHWHELTQA